MRYFLVSGRAKSSFNSLLLLEIFSALRLKTSSCDSSTEVKTKDDVGIFCSKHSKCKEFWSQSITPSSNIPSKGKIEVYVKRTLTFFKNKVFHQKKFGARRSVMTGVW